jgi:hypothetical protein
MKLFTLYSSILTALSLGVSANPVPYSSINAVDANIAYPLDVRAAPSAKTPAAKAPATVVPIKTKRYDAAVGAAAKEGKRLEPSKWYVFTKEWDLPDPVEGTFESKTDLQKLQQKLGFEHVAVVVGQVTEVKRGKGKNEKVTLDFDAYYMDLMKDDDLVTSILRGPKRLDPDEPVRSKQILKWSKSTTAAKGSSAAMGKVGKAYFQEAGHQKYNVDSNNCATFRDAVLPKF